MIIIMSPKGESPHTTICNIRIGRKGACKLPKNPNVQIAAGPDAVLTKYLNDFASELAPVMTKLRIPT